MEVNVWTVLLAASITALMTGLGAAPFLLVRQVDDRLLAHANAIEAGLMLAASHALMSEGVSLNPQSALLGILLGLAAIVASKALLDNDTRRRIADLSGVNAHKAILLLGIMTAHSFAEAVGVGVAFGGTEELGTFITAAIALHNIPEGLAIALVLVPRGTSIPQASAWSIFTSLSSASYGRACIPICCCIRTLIADWFRFGCGSYDLDGFCRAHSRCNRKSARR